MCPGPPSRACDDSCEFIGRLLGIKTASNEFVAYAALGQAAADGEVSHRALVIASYALCGFANL